MRLLKKKEKVYYKKAEKKMTKKKLTFWNIIDISKVKFYYILFAEAKRIKII